MALNKIKPKFYVYGCKQLLHDLEELIDSAGEYEDSGRSTDDWLIDLGNSKPGERALGTRLCDILLWYITQVT